MARATQTRTDARLITGEEVSQDTAAVIVAAGAGTRFGDKRGKQFVSACGLPLVSWSLLAFDQAPSVGQIVVVCPAGRVDEVRSDVVGPLSLGTPVALVEGGATRQESSRRGVRAADARWEYVAIHDGARPLVTTATIENAIAYLRCDPDLVGAVCANPVTDTLKLVEQDTIVATPDRSLYWAVQTPQVFRARRIRMYHDAAAREGFAATDDASLAEHYGGRVRCVLSPRNNVKVTVPEDLLLVEAVLDQRICGMQDERRHGGGAGRGR